MLEGACARRCKSYSMGPGLPYLGNVQPMSELGLATIHLIVRAGDEGGLVGEQEAHDVGDLVDLPTRPMAVFAAMEARTSGGSARAEGPSIGPGATAYVEPNTRTLSEHRGLPQMSDRPSRQPLLGNPRIL